MLDRGHERRRRRGIPVSTGQRQSRRPGSRCSCCPPRPAAKPDTARPHHSGAPAGWVALSRDPSPLIAHWGTVGHLQTHLAHRNQGIGSALMHRLREVARDEMGLEQLHLAARGGMGLEDFYARLGWRVTGRWPGKLRFAPDDTRDEILMILTPL
jgi:GNAT superfamily N-acetyltransferase